MKINNETDILSNNTLNPQLVSEEGFTHKKPQIICYPFLRIGYYLNINAFT